MGPKIYFYHKSFISNFISPLQNEYNSTEQERFGKFIYTLRTDNFIPEVETQREIFRIWGSICEYSWKKNSPFRELVESLNDISYNREVSRFSDYRDVLPEDVLGITLRCIDDYDQQHPAGSMLNDLATLEWLSPYAYIQSGYVSSTANGWITPELEDWYKTCDDEWVKYHGSLEDRSIFPIKLLGAMFHIAFKSNPEKRCRIRIEMELESGVQASEFMYPPYSSSESK